MEHYAVKHVQYLVKALEYVNKARTLNPDECITFNEDYEYDNVEIALLGLINKATYNFKDVTTNITKE